MYYHFIYSNELINLDIDQQLLLTSENKKNRYYVLQFR